MVQARGACLRRARLEEQLDALTSRLRVECGVELSRHPLPHDSGTAPHRTPRITRDHAKVGRATTD